MNMKIMTANEKVAMCIGFLRGLVGDSKYVLTINPDSVREFLKELEINP